MTPDVDAIGVMPDLRAIALDLFKTARFPI